MPAQTLELSRSHPHLTLLQTLQRPIPSKPLLPPQIINHHVPPRRNPPPAKPPHLTPMRRRHRPPPLEIILPPSHQKQRRRRLPRIPLPRQENDAQNRRRRIQHAGVLAQHVYRCERVELHRARPARMSRHESLEEGQAAVVEGGVVWVGGDAVAVKGDEDVDGGGRGGFGGVFGVGGREGAEEEGGDVGGRPVCGHGVGEVAMCRGLW